MEQSGAFKKWRWDGGWTLRDAADHLGVSVSTVSRWESGEMLPDADMIDRIARMTGGAVTPADMHAIRLDWLKTNRPEKFPEPLPEAAE